MGKRSDGGVFSVQCAEIFGEWDFFSRNLLIFSACGVIIKTIMPIIACAIFGNMKSKFDRCKVISVKGIVGAVVTLLFMTLGYVVFGAIIAGSFAAGLASAPGLLLKSVVNMVVYLFVATGMSKILGRK